MMKRWISMLLALMLLMLGMATAEDAADDAWEYELVGRAIELVRQMDAQERGRLFEDTLNITEVACTETPQPIDRGMPRQAFISVNGTEDTPLNVTAATYDQGLQLADWNGYAARQAESKARGRLRGRGIATFLEWTGGNALEERVSVNVTADGIIEIGSATQAMGQGIATSYVQLAVDVFGVPPGRVRILQGDTDRYNGFGSAGSRSLFTGGTSLRIAAERTVDKGKELAAEALEAPVADIEYREGRFAVAGTDLGIDLAALAAKQPEQRIFVDSTAKVGGPTWPNGCHVCEVEVDPATGAVEVVAYASVNDIGRIVSPVIVRGQIEGGAVQGIGQALCERVAYDRDTGQLLSASFMDYALPHADGFRGFKTAFDTRIPCLTNALGVKGVGELGTIGATPAVVNAVVDALATSGGLGRDAEKVQMPLTSEVIWRALNRRDFGPPVFPQPV